MFLRFSHISKTGCNSCLSSLASTRPQQRFCRLMDYRRKMRTLLLITLLAFTAFAQVDDYSRHPVNKKQAVKFHLALKLLEGGWNDTQKGIILKAINNPSPALEAEVTQAFAPSEARL